LSKSRAIDPATLGGDPWVFSGVPPGIVRKKIDSAGVPLARYVLGDFSITEEEIPGAYIISRKEYETVIRKDPVAGAWLRPLVSSAGIRRYNPLRYSAYIVRIPAGMTRKLAGPVPDLWEWFHDHHHTLAGMLMDRRTPLQKPGVDVVCWWEWPVPAAPSFLDDALIITWPRRECSGPEWMMVPAGVVPGNGVFAIPGNNPALAGILNSTLSKFYILSSARKKGMTGYNRSHLLKFPVPVPEPDDIHENERFRMIALLVHRRSELGKARDIAPTEGEAPVQDERIQECDEEIDLLVNEMYRLTPAETDCILTWLWDHDKCKGQ
jgi:hypothetical protein